MTGDRGSAAIEFGLAFPLLVMLLAGIADLGRALWLHHALAKSAETAGRYLARAADPTNAASQAAAAQLAGGATFTLAAVGDATWVTTTATAVFQPVAALPFASGFTLQVSHVERCLGQ